MLVTGYRYNSGIYGGITSPQFCASDKKENIRMAEFQNYRKVNPEFNQEEVVKTVKSRVPSLPKLMNLLVSAPVEYIEGIVGAKKFSNDYVGNFVPFAKRIAVGENHEEYCQNYDPEIKMIKKVEKACDSFINKDSGVTNLNSELEKALDKYAKTNIKRTKLFIA